MKKKDEKPKSEEKYKDREDAFRAYFEIITKIVYTLNLISDRNDMTRRLSSNIDRALGYDDEVVSNNEKTLNNANEIDLLVNSLKGDVRKISTFKKYNFNIEKFIAERELNLDERFILYSVLVYTIYGDSMSAISIRRILELITLNSDIYINKYHYFDSKSKLMSSGIFVLSHEPYPSGGILEISNTLVTFVNSKVILTDSPAIILPATVPGSMRTGTTGSSAAWMTPSMCRATDSARRKLNPFSLRIPQ